MLVLAVTWSDLADIALAVFLLVVGLSGSATRSSGWAEPSGASRRSSRGTQHELLPVINKVGGTRRPGERAARQARSWRPTARSTPSDSADHRGARGQLRDPAAGAEAHRACRRRSAHGASTARRRATGAARSRRQGGRGAARGGPRRRAAATRADGERRDHAHPAARARVPPRRASRRRRARVAARPHRRDARRPPARARRACSSSAEATRATITMRARGDGALRRDDRAVRPRALERAELARERGDDLGLRRVLDTVVDDVEPGERRRRRLDRADEDGSTADAASDDRELLRRYHEHGDLAAREQLIEQYMSLVRSLARRYCVPRRAARRSRPDRRDRTDQGDRPLRPRPRRRADDVRDAEHHRRDQAALPRQGLGGARAARAPGAERPAVEARSSS